MSCSPKRGKIGELFVMWFKEIHDVSATCFVRHDLYNSVLALRQADSVV